MESRDACGAVDLVEREGVVRRAQEGCADSFARLYSDLSAHVRRVAYRRTRDHHEAEDAAQDAFLCAYRRLDRLADPRRFENWLVRIARNRAIDRSRDLARCRPSERAHDDSLDRAADLPRVLLRTGGGEVPPDRVALLRGTLEEMSPPLRAALRLRYERGLSCREIARAEGVSVEAVKTRLHRARLRVRAAMLGCDGRPPAGRRGRSRDGKA